MNASHPKPAELAAFHHGRLDAADQARIEQHVSGCESCCEVLRKLPEDTLVERLRRGDTSRDGSSVEQAASQILKDASPADRTHTIGDSGPPKELADHLRYRILRKLGAGGMGVVYQAEHRLMERQVALKVINQSILSNPVAIERFRIEVKAAARLSHPNIVAAHDADEAGNLHFLVMEFVEGASLDRVVAKNGPLSVLHAANFVRQAALGLQHAFEKGMVHRDIKPQNLMLTPKRQVKILDFGLARVGRQIEPSLSVEGDPIANAATQLTAMGSLLGTPDYMAPEQITDPSKSDIRSDIYSLGCTLYYLLTARVPFPDSSVFDKLNGHIEREPRSLAELRPDVPPDLVRVVDRMMAKAPARRFQTPTEVAKSLTPFAKTGSAVETEKPGKSVAPELSPIVEALLEESAGWRTTPSSENPARGVDATYDLQPETEVMGRSFSTHRRRSIAVNSRLFVLAGGVLAVIGGLFWIVPKLSGTRPALPMATDGSKMPGATAQDPGTAPVVGVDSSNPKPAIGEVQTDRGSKTRTQPPDRSVAESSRPFVAGATSADDIGRLSDEFDDAANLGQWSRLAAVEGRPVNFLERFDVGESRSGWLTLVPRSNSWFQEFRGEFLFKLIEGDFIALTHVKASSRQGDSAPRTSYSLAGLLVRAPRQISQQTWEPGGENFLFHAFGVSGEPRVWQMQTMNTTGSTSRIATADGPDGDAILGLIRVGPHFVLAASKEGGAAWRIAWRHHRPDLPQLLQVGLMCSTDWVMCKETGREQYDVAGVAKGLPDLVAQFEYVRFRRPQLPGELIGKELSNSDAVPDHLLMKFFASLSAAGVARTPGEGSPIGRPDSGSRSTPSAAGTNAANSQRTESPAENKPSARENAGQPAVDNLAALSDEFNNQATAAEWKHVYEVEKWGANQLENFDIDKTRRGKMLMMPYTSSWYKDLRGVLAFKEVTGDFVVTTDVEVTNRNGTGPPRSQFSLAGIMVRTPRNVTPQTWKPGGENYIFLSLGAADRPGFFQFEVKTTINSDSQLQISDGARRATIQVARIGQHFITLKKPAGGSWTVHHRYHRPDMPATLQVGLTSYTDWPTVAQFQNDPIGHNRTVIRRGNPDLIAAFDFVRYHRPQGPAELAGRNLSDPSAVSDDLLLKFLGDMAAARATGQAANNPDKER